MKKTIKFLGSTAYDIRVIITLSIMYLYKVDIRVFWAYVIYLTLSNNKTFDVIEEHFNAILFRIILEWIAFIGLIVIIFPKEKNINSIIWLIVWAAILKFLYKPIISEEK